MNTVVLILAIWIALGTVRFKSLPGSYGRYAKWYEIVLMLPVIVIVWAFYSVIKIGRGK